MNSTLLGIQHFPNADLTNASDVSQLIKLWQKRLKLSAYSIDVGVASPSSDDRLMEIHIYPKRLAAVIRISDKVRGLTNQTASKLVLHELLHIVLHPIREEHHMQMKWLATDRAGEYRARHLTEIEVATEHLTNVLYEQYAKRP